MLFSHRISASCGPPSDVSIRRHQNHITKWCQVKLAIKACSLLLLALVGVQTALAADDGWAAKDVQPWSMTSFGYDPGLHFYAGGSLGATDASSLGSYASAGAFIAWQPVPVFSLEANDQYLGGISYQGSTLFGDSIALSALLHTPDLQGLSGYLRIGEAHDGLYLNSSELFSANQPVIGVGLQYQTPSRVFVRLEYRRFQNFGHLGVAVGNVSLGVAARF